MYKSYLLYLGIFLFSISQIAIGQNEPYYEPVGKRSLEDLRFLPNLDTEQRRIYIELLGAVRSTGSDISPSSQIFTATRSTELFWGVGLGFNKADNFLYEIGYAKNPIYNDLTLKERASSTSGFPVSRGRHFNEFSIRIKKKIVQVDKVSQKAGLFLLTGLLYSPDLANNDLGTTSFGSRQFYGPNIPPDTVYHTISSFTSKHSFAFELGAEISGRLNEQIGIGFFVKSSLRPKGVVENTLTYRVNNGPSENFTQQLSALNFNVGVLFYLNAINWVKYRSKEIK